MIRFASLLAGCRRATLLFGLVVVVFLPPASAAQAQRLLTLVSGVGEASAGDPGPLIGPTSAPVQVDLELLRGAPARLEVPTPDGSILSAERSVFKDRGGGDLMWSGGQGGAGYDTVVLTVEDGRLVGRFGAAGGGAYQIHAERDGRGGMAPIAGLRPDGASFCAVETVTEEAHDAVAHVLAGALAADPPWRVSNPQSHDRLDILVAYTAMAAENWAGRGGALAAIRHAGDYLKMVFRNNRIEVEPHIVHIAQASAALDRAERDVGWHEVESLITQIGRDGDLLRLRHEHRADFMHLFTGEPARLRGFGPCGVHYLMSKGSTAKGSYAFGWTKNDPKACPDYAATFVHELGHGLGAHHDPANVQHPERLIRPYAFGHANYDVMPSLGTAMSYNGQIEPFFSTPRIRPHGAVLGIAGERDNERVLQEAVQIGVQYSDYLRSLEGAPAPPSDLRVRFEGGSARLAWQDNAPDADGYEVDYRWWISRQASFSRRQAIEGRSEATLPLEGTEPGRRYDFWVTARNGEARSLRSSIVRLVFPGEPIAVPSEVSATVTPRLTRVDVRWTDNSDNESGFDVQLLQDGEPIARNRAEADSEHSGFEAWWVRPQGGAEYGVRVFAYNSSGYSESSDVATFRWTQPAAPGPVTDAAASAIGPTTVRLTWVGNSESDYYYVTARLKHWEQIGFLARAGAGWVDFEGLARGGRYTFNVRPNEDRSHGFAIDNGVFDSRAYLTLGERGMGPRAPSDLSWAMTDDGQVRVSWKDNSSDELGFEVQSRGAFASEDGSWIRLVTVPPDTESAVVESVHVGQSNFRVFAYNERGFSATSPTATPHVPRKASFRLDIPCGEELCRTLTGTPVSFLDTSGGNVTERHWSFGDGAGSDRRSPTHAWSSPGYYDVTLTVSDGSSSDSATRTVLVEAAAPAGSCRVDAETLCLQDSRFEVKMDWWSAAAESGAGRVVYAGTNDSGLFRFFNPQNWEVLIKVLDGCAINQRTWVLGASTTDLGYRILVTDTVTGESRSYENEPGLPAPAIVDTEAFPCVGTAVH